MTFGDFGHGFTQWNTGAAISAPQHVKGCEECNRRGEPKPWPIFTIDYHGEEVCAKCLTPMRYPRLDTQREP